MKKAPIYINKKKKYKTIYITFIIIFSLLLIYFIAEILITGISRNSIINGIISLTLVISLWIGYTREKEKVLLNEVIATEENEAKKYKKTTIILPIFIVLTAISSWATFQFMKTDNENGKIIMGILTAIFGFITAISFFFLMRYIGSKGRIEELKKEHPQTKTPRSKPRPTKPSF